MNAIFRILFTAFLCSVSTILIAQSVNISEAKAIAEHHLTSVSRSTLKSAGSKGRNFQFASIKATVENKDTLYYILNDTINKGFVIVSADKRAWPILGYSTEGSFDEKKQPEAFVEWMNNRKKEIESIKKNNLQPDPETLASWQNLEVASPIIHSTSVEPLIQTQWDQGCFYNYLCPSDAQSPHCGHVLTGCTATAMAQIMKYWNFPTKGIGSHSYSHPTYGELSANFGSTTYQWSQMPNSLTSPNDAVATLMYHCGVSLEMDYGPWASGAWDPRDELVQYFNYSSKSIVINRKGLNSNAWNELLKSEIDLGHPIWYMGISITVGHSFICDGYQDEDYFHFNWGWRGNLDGYFYTGNLNPRGYNLNEEQSVIINLVPGDLPDGYNGFFLSSNNLDIATNGGTNSVDICSSAQWTASSDQTWLSLSTNSGVSGKTTLILTAPANQSENERLATITISAPGFSDQIITINQLAAIKTTPGSLYSSISKKATSITKLTLTGCIDARDFKTMRDAMPALTDVDLSNVTIVAYNGTGGTIDQSRAYRANEIPDDALNIIPCHGQNLIKSFILPTSTISIGGFAFGNCKYLTTINIPSSVSEISNIAFDACPASIDVDPKNLNYSSVDGVLFNKIKTTIIHCPISKAGNYTIPSSVTSIGNMAFKDCLKLTTLKIPSSVKIIESYAFIECRGLTEVFIPQSVTAIESDAFLNCGASINVDPNNRNYSSVNGDLFNKSQTTLIHCLISKNGNFTIPTSVNTIGRYAFSDCNKLTGITIPTSVTTIELGAFNACGGLTEIIIPSSVTSIEYQTFNFCIGLRSVVIPASVISIDIYAFTECSNLSSIYVYSISPVNLNNSIDVFYNVDKNKCILYVPFGSKAQYATAIQWKDFTNMVEMPGIFLSSQNLGISSTNDQVQIKISSSADWTATSDQPWLTVSPANGIAGSNAINFTASANPTTDPRTATVTVSATGLASQKIVVMQLGKFEVSAGNLKTILAGQLATITSLSLNGTIDARDFKTMRDEMPALRSIDLDSVTIVEYSGFEGTDGKWNTYYPKNGIPNYAFFSPDTYIAKKLLNTIKLPASLTSIGGHSFYGCEGLTSINIPQSVTWIEDYVFSGCKSLGSIDIPPAVIYIGNHSFDVYNGLINVDKNNLNYSSIDGILFNKNQTEIIRFPSSKTGSYTIPSSVTSIGSNSFYLCSGLENVTIPSSVTSIGSVAFAYCNGLTSVELPLFVASIGEHAFNECEKLISITIPPKITSIGNRAFYYCKELRSIYIYKKSPPSLDNSLEVFGLVDQYNCTLYVPYGSKIAYQKASQWRDFAKIVEMPNQAPVANAGLDQIVKAGKLVTLNSDGSTYTEGDSLTYKWTAPNGITLSDRFAAKPIFTAPNVVTNTDFIFSLVVNDGFLDSPGDQVTVTVIPNQIPVAITEKDQTVNEGDIVWLDASNSYDFDKDVLSYRWIAPEGITLSSATNVQPSFTAPEVVKDTTYSFTLVVNDGTLDSSPDELLVTVKQVNKAPVANAGSDQSINESKRVLLSAGDSYDLDKDILSYHWIAPEGITLSSTTAVQSHFTAPEVAKDTIYSFMLIVNDGTLDSAPDEILVTVKQVNKAPVANAGVDLSVNEGDLVSLNAGNSYDFDKDVLSYRWTAPEGITLSSATVVQPYFSAPKVNSNSILTFSLVVNDGTVSSPADKIVVKVKNVDKAPYLKNPILDISADKRDPDQIIDLQTVFADDDLGDVISYSITSNTNSQVVTAKLVGSDLTISFSSQNVGSSEIVITAKSNGKEVTSKFNVEVKIPTGIDLIVFDESFMLYPNPTTGKLKLVFNETPKSAILISVNDNTGKSCLKQLIREKEAWIDLSGNAPGIYFIKTDQKYSLPQKVIVK